MPGPRWLLLGSILAAALGSAGCRDEAKAGPAQPAAHDDPGTGVCADEPDAAPACASAEWCTEHGVLEADCRICNPDGGRPQ